MTSKIGSETMKIQAPGAVLESSGDPLGCLGGLGDFRRDVVEIFGEDGPQMGAR